MKQKSVMFCWELGGGLGHVTKAVLLAEQLLDAGCEVTFAFKDLADVHALLPMDDYRLVQSPVWLRNVADAGDPGSYPEVLLHFGFGSPTGLMGLCRAWRSLFEAFSVDLVIADHAPNAVLAARTLAVPVVLYGNGFFSPPISSPIPPYRPASATGNARSASAEALALASANQCLQAFGLPAMSQLSDLFAGARNLLCTVPELDHYPQRATGDSALTHFCGPVYVDQVGAVLPWPQQAPVARKRIFAYLYAAMPGLEHLLAALADSGAEVAIYCGGIAPDLERQFVSADLRFVRGLINLKAMAAEVDLFVCGGTDTAYCALFNGLPLLGVPAAMEQQITCERIQALGAGLWAPPGSDRAHWSGYLRRLLDDPSFADQAKAFAGRFPDYSPDDAIDRIADECLAVLSVAPNP